MSVLTVVLVILGGLILYLLFAPFYLVIDTNAGIYAVRFHTIAGANIIGKNDSLYLKWQVLGWGREVNLLAHPGRSRETKSKKSSRSSLPSWSRIRTAFASFKVNRFSLRMDTEDMALNGILYPWFVTASWLTQRDLWINFYQRNELILEIENNAFRLLKAYLFPTH